MTRFIANLITEVLRDRSTCKVYKKFEQAQRHKEPQ